MKIPTSAQALYLMSLTLLGLNLMACGSRSFDLAPASARDVVKNAPDWMSEVPEDDDFLTATATATSRDMQVAFDKARTAAQADVAQQLGARLDDVTRRFVEEVGEGINSELLSSFTATTKAITSERITGTHVVEREVRAESDMYRAYVMVRMPIGAANQRLM